METLEQGILRQKTHRTVSDLTRMIERATDLLYRDSVNAVDWLNYATELRNNVNALLATADYIDTISEKQIAQKAGQAS